MNTIYSKFFDVLEVGDNQPTVIMGVLNLSPESFYKGSVYKDVEKVQQGAIQMISSGAKIIDIGARSTAPGTQSITIEEETKRLTPALEKICKIVPDNIIVSVDTQYRDVAEEAYAIASENNKKMMINDVSCLKTDPHLKEFIIEKEIPSILMASKNLPGDILSMEEILKEFTSTIKTLEERGYNTNKLILDPGIGHWIPEKTYEYDLQIIKDLSTLKMLEKPILVAISRKSFIGNTLNIPEPENRLNGTLSATAISVFNGAHIVRTHDVNKQLLEIVKMARAIRNSKNT